MTNKDSMSDRAFGGHRVLRGTNQAQDANNRNLIILDRDRLGEMLVLRGVLSAHDLRRALREQKARSAPLGRILLERGMITRSRLYKALCHQWAMRCVAAALGLFLITVSGTDAQAGTIKDIPPQVRLASAANAAFAPMSSYPALFGSQERRSATLDPFTKWSGMFDRFNAAMSDPRNRQIVQRWQADIARLQGLPLEDMARQVNTLMNAQPYIVDSRNWGRSDYWATPVEFFTRGGDCEDFAIAKYASLRALGVPEERLRVAIVHDQVKDIPHAILIVYTQDGALILDNQSQQVRLSDYVSRYRPIFSINRQAWWLHTPPSATVVASR